MAEEKKPEKKDSPPPAPKDPFVEIVGFFIFLMFIVYALNSLITGISSSKLFSRGWAGLTPYGIILSNTRPIASLNTALNSRIVTLKDTAVYGSPGGTEVGTQKFNSRGKIIQGPVTIGSDTYWYVDYDSGPDGWVKESDIAYLENEPSLLGRMIIKFFDIVGILRIISVFLTIAFIIWMVYLIRGLTKLRQTERALLYPELAKEEPVTINPKWDRIITHIESLNENDWRLAIIEADIMLDELLDKLSLHGETMGDKLKTVEKSDFQTIDNAWEAHKIRNNIAHQGSDFQLTQREARRVVELYRTVFEEFEII